MKKKKKKERDIMLFPVQSCKIIGFSRISGHISHRASHQKGYRPNYRLYIESETRRDENEWEGEKGQRDGSEYLPSHYVQSTDKYKRVCARFEGSL